MAKKEADRLAMEGPALSKTGPELALGITLAARLVPHFQYPDRSLVVF